MRGGCAAFGCLLLTACGGGAPPGPVTPIPATAAAPARDPSKDGLPLLAEIHVGSSDHIFQGGDDHVTIAVTNRGRDILHFAFWSPLWVRQHDLAMGATRSCLPDEAAGLVDCGPVYAGESRTFQLRALPVDVGSWDYEGRFYERAGADLLPIAAASAPSAPLVVRFHEDVIPQTNQVQGYHPEPSPSPS